MSNSLSMTMYQHLNKELSGAVFAYTNLSPEERAQMEKEGITFSNFVLESILPYIYNVRVSSILIVMEEGIGNMVMLTPAIRLLKHFNPRLKITIWGKEPAVQVIRGWDCVDNVITEFDYSHYDLCYYTIWSQNTKSKFHDTLMQYSKQFIESSIATYHESLQHTFVCSFLDNIEQLTDYHCELPPADTHEMIDQTIVAETGGSKYIVFGDTLLRDHGWERKRWPHYVELANMINKKFPEYKIVLTGDETDAAEADKKEWPENVIKDFIGKITIKELAYLIKKADMYVGNDTGPTHIAAAVGTKTYAIFGPTRLAKNKPLGQNVTVISKQMWCSPCQYTEQWEQCSEWNCLAELTAPDVYNEIFFPQPKKKRVLLVGDFTPNMLRAEIYIKKVLERDLKMKVIQFEYRKYIEKVGNVRGTFEIVNEAINKDVDMVLICGGQQVIPQVLNNLCYIQPKTKIVNWYADNRGQVEQWFSDLSAVCHNSYWTTGDPALLSKVYSQTLNPCTFLPQSMDDKSFIPIDVKKDIDVLFVGTPHSAPRIELLEHLAKNGVNLSIYGNGDWPQSLQKFAKPGIIGDELNKVLNRSKIVIGINIVNNCYLYFSDRYFMPLAVKTVGLNKYVPGLETMFEDNKHMVFFNSNEECLQKINELLVDDKRRADIAQAGHDIFLEKYTLKHMLERMIEDVL